MYQINIFGEEEKIEDVEMSYQEKIDHAINVMKLASDISETYYKKPLLIMYSGGKDSDVLLDVAIKSGINFEVFHAITTVDAPDTNRHVNKVFGRLKDMGINTNKKVPTYRGEPTNMWKQIVYKDSPPTRIARHCCTVLKEASAPNRIIAIGVRRSESSGRQGRDDFATRGKTKKDAKWFSFDHATQVFNDAKKVSQEHNKPIEDVDVYDCTMVRTAKEKKDLICNPIYDMTDIDVWEYIERERVEINQLYSKGFSRVGCIGCPLAGKYMMRKQFAMFPHFKEQYIKAFDKMLEKRREQGKTCEDKTGYNRWETGQDVFDWWINSQDTVYGQMSMFDE